MKKLYLLFMSLVCLCSLSTYANSPCDAEMPSKPKTECRQPCRPNPCPQTYQTPSCTTGFLCTNKDMNSVFRNMNLSESQICNAEKIQSKYAQEVLSINERIGCEKEKLCQMKSACAKWNETRKQKKLIKKLEKKRKEICKCYEKQFKATLSDMQRKQYNKNKKCK